MKFKYDSVVHNSMEEVWDFIMDFDRRSEWIHFFDKSFITHQTDNWIGTKYKEKLTFLGIPLFIEYEITEYVHQTYWKSKCKMPPFYPKIHCTAKDNGDGTIFSSLEFDIKLGPFFLVPKKLIQNQVDNLIEPFINNYIEILDKK